MHSSFVSAFAFAISLICLPADAGERTRYLELINRAHDRVTKLSLAPAGSRTYRELLQGEQVRGGGGATTVQIVTGHCRHDVLVEFADGRRALYPDVDICRHRGLRVRPLPAAERRQHSGGDAQSG
ncbi:MAG TPA: hypothetical protein VLF15_07340 [Pseudoxanthomonas sp.]|nr:hypothetical protein [Pseudoxanthomonas sp.]